MLFGDGRLVCFVSMLVCMFVSIFVSIASALFYVYASGYVSALFCM